MIAEDRGSQIAKCSAIVCDHMETHFCDRLRSWDRDRWRSHKIEPCSIFCDRLRSIAIVRSYGNQSSAICDRNLSHNVCNGLLYFAKRNENLYFAKWKCVLYEMESVLCEMKSVLCEMEICTLRSFCEPSIDWLILPAIMNATHVFHFCRSGIGGRVLDSSSTTTKHFQHGVSKAQISKTRTTYP